MVEVDDGNGEFLEVYKGWIINPGIVMPSYGIHEYWVCATREELHESKPRHIAETVEDARKWIDEQEQTLEEREARRIQGLEVSGEYTWRLINKRIGEITSSAEIYDTKYSAQQAMIETVREMRGRDTYEFEIISTPSGEVMRVIMTGYINPSGDIEGETEYGPYY